MTPHDRDKMIALLKSVAAACETKGRAEHAWRKCRHCLAIAELESYEVRAQLAEFIQVAARSPGSQEQP